MWQHISQGGGGEGGGGVGSFAMACTHLRSSLSTHCSPAHSHCHLHPPMVCTHARAHHCSGLCVCSLLLTPICACAYHCLCPSVCAHHHLQLLCLPLGEEEEEEKEERVVVVVFVLWFPPHCSCQLLLLVDLLALVLATPLLTSPGLYLHCQPQFVYLSNI